MPFTLSSKQKQTLLEWGIALLLLCVGLCLTFCRTLTSGLNIISGDLGDARLVYYILEANVKHLMWGQDVWQLPFYYPTQGVLAYSDTYLLPTLVYAPIRMLAGFAAAYPLWLMALTGINFVAMYVVARKLLNARFWLSVLIAYMFAFPLVQAVQLNHPQSLLRMFVPFAVYALYRFLQVRQVRYLVYFGICIMLSVYGAVYVGIFLALFGGIVLLLWGVYELCIKREHKDAHFLDISISRKDIVALCILVLGTAYIGLQFMRYAPAPGSNEEIAFALAPTPLEHVAYPEGSLIASVFPFLSRGAVNNNDVSVAVGVVYAVLLLLTVIRAVQEKQGSELFMLLAALLLYVLSTKYGNFFPWAYVNHILPGASVIRATGRVWMVAYPAFLFGALVVWGKAHIRNMVFVGICLLYVFENMVISTHTFRMSESETRIKAIQSKIPKSCTVMALAGADYVVDGKIESLYTHIDAMHASLRNRVKLVGGYTGYRPAHYPVTIDASSAKSLLQEGDTLCVVR